MFDWFGNPFYGYEEDPREARLRQAREEQRRREEYQRQYEEYLRRERQERQERLERQEREERARRARQARAAYQYPDFLSSFFGYPSESSESAVAGGRSYTDTEAESSDAPRQSYRPRDTRPATSRPSGPKPEPHASAKTTRTTKAPAKVTAKAPAPPTPSTPPAPARAASSHKREVVGDLSRIPEPQAPPPAQAFRTYSQNAARPPVSPPRPLTSPCPVQPGDSPAAWDKQEVVALSSADSSIVDTEGSSALPEISETSSHFLIQIAVSDKDRGAIAVELNARNELTVRAHQKVHGNEIAIERKYTLPSHLVDRTDVSAKLDDGVLRIHIPKTQNPDSDILKIEVE